MRSIRFVAVLVLALSISACYHATVDTGRVPSGQTVDREWAHSFIGGLVPPSTVETASRCPNGVARVDTQLSFLNMVVGVFTSGIYTPMSIVVQCAAAGSAAATFDAGTDAGVAFQRAIEQSASSGEAAYIRF